MTTTAVEPTPRLRTSAKRAAFWIVAVLFMLVVALLIVGGQGSGVGGDPFAGDNAAPVGSKALVEVLKDQGVDVELTSTLEATTDEIRGRVERTTLLIYDPLAYLTDAQLESASLLAEHVVLVDPGFDQLQTLAPGVNLAGRVDGPLDADCNLAAVEKAGVVSGDAQGYRVDDDTDAVTCLGGGDDVYTLVQLESTVGVITVLGTTGALTNEQIILDGNAALALNLLGEHERLVWYLPSFDDLELDTSGQAPSSPPWLTPGLTLLLAAGVAAAIWRGRRLGPLVVEPLPVTVQASETLLGRARLYERSGARLRALDALRVGTVQRLAKLCGLSRRATVDEVILAVAAVTGRTQAEVRMLLLDASPASDPELVERSDDLLTLEQDVARAVRPGS